MKKPSIKNKLKICMLTTSYLDMDSRILNEAQVLSSQYDLTILAKNHSKPRLLGKTPFRVKRISFKQKRFFILNILLSFIALMKAALKENPDIYHAHDLDGLICAFMAAVIKKKILVYDSHELWTGSIVLKGRPYLKPLVAFVEKILMIKVKEIITVNDSLAIFLSKKYHRPTLSLYNFPTLKTKKGQNLKLLFPNKKLILYLGGITPDRGLEKIIESSKLLDSSYLVLFVGYGKSVEKIKELIAGEGMDSMVKVLPPLPPDRIVDSIKGIDLGLCLIEAVVPSYYYSTPNKLFQYISAGVPVLSSNFPEMKRFVQKYEIGDVVDPSKPRLIARKIQDLTRAGLRKKFIKNLSKIQPKLTWQNESPKLLGLYQKLSESCRE